MHLLWAVDDRNGPEQNIACLLAEGPRELIEIEVVVLGVFSVPCEFGPANAYLLAVMGDDSELARKILLLDLRLNGILRECVSGNRLQNDPALEESVGAWSLLS